MNDHRSGGTDLVVATTSYPGVEARLAKATHSEDDWFCGWCLSPVTHDDHRFTWSGQDEFNFANPEGIHFQIITFSCAPGCRASGQPTLEFTWFPGHAWSYGHCAQCGQHLGWFYAGAHRFVGLIKDRLVRGAHLRN